MRYLTIISALYASAHASSPVIFAALVSDLNTCASGYSLCAPPDVTTIVTPQIGDSDLQDLYTDILSSSLPSFKKRSLSSRGSASVCCITSLTCLAMSSLAIPFCYDKFTTNYYLPDGSYGTLVSGKYTSSTGDEANLQSGNYTLVNGTTGNIYADDEAKKPNTATLAIPSQYTAAGVGGAIPASALGDMVTLTYTTTVPASTQLPATIDPTTVPGSTRTIASVYEPSTTITTVISSSTVIITHTIATSQVTSVILASTIPGTTLELSTKESSVGIVTATVASSVASSITSASTATAATTSKKSAGSRQEPWVEGILLGLVMGYLGTME